MQTLVIEAWMPARAEADWRPGYLAEMFTACGPDDETQEVEVEPVRGPADDYDDDRRRFEGEQLLHLTADEWDVIGDLIDSRVPLQGVGSRCAHTPMRLPEDFVGGVVCRPAVAAMGGTFVIFPN